MNFIAKCVRVLTHVRAWVREVERTICEQSPTDHQGEEIKGSKNLPRYEVRAALSFDDETVRIAKAESQQEQGIQNSIKKATWAAVLAASVYAGIAAWQLCEMRKATIAATTQTKLLSDQLKGTMSAIVRFEEPRLTNDPITQSPMLVILLTNGGHVIAPKTSATLRIETLSFPDLKTTLDTQVKPLNINELDPGESHGSNYAMRDFPERQRHFATQTMTLRVSGDFSYENGFGDSFKQPFCYSYIGSYNVKNEGAGSTSGGDGFYPCDRFSELIPFILQHPLR